MVGNGRNCKFWSNNWSPFGRLKNYLGAGGTQTSGIRSNATLADLWLNGNWVLPPARSELLVNLQSYLTTIQITDGHDSYEWWFNGILRHSYGTGEVYKFLKEHGPKVTWDKVVWNYAGIPRNQFLCWLFVLNRCPTRDMILNWGLSTYPRCLLCNLESESRNHLFVECNFSWIIWKEVTRRCSMIQLRQWDQNIISLIFLPDRTTKKILLTLCWQALFTTSGQRGTIVCIEISSDRLLPS